MKNFAYDRLISAYFTFQVNFCNFSFVIRELWLTYRLQYLKLRFWTDHEKNQCSKNRFFYNEPDSFFFFFLFFIFFCYSFFTDLEFFFLLCSVTYLQYLFLNYHEKIQITYFWRYNLRFVSCFFSSFGKYSEFQQKC